MIKGPNVEFKLIRNSDRNFLFECLEDWNPDSYGPFTEKRAIDTIDLSIRENQYFKIPVVYEDDFHVTFVVYRAGVQIAVTRAHVIKSHVHVTWLAIHPSQRGKGYFREIYLCWSYSTFEVFKANKLSFIVREGIPEVEHLIDKFSGVETPNSEIWNGALDTEEPKRKWEHTREDYLRDRDEGFKDKENNLVSFTLDKDNVPSIKLPKVPKGFEVPDQPGPIEIEVEDKPKKPRKPRAPKG